MRATAGKDILTMQKTIILAGTFKIRTMTIKHQWTMTEAEEACIGLITYILVENERYREFIGSRLLSYDTVSYDVIAVYVA